MFSEAPLCISRFLAIPLLSGIAAIIGYDVVTTGIILIKSFKSVGTPQVQFWALFQSELMSPVQ
jgi:hypothetical protein